MSFRNSVVPNIFTDYALDSSDLECWTLNDPAGSTAMKNQGSDSTSPTLSLISSPFLATLLSPILQCPLINGANGSLKVGFTSVAGKGEPPYPITLSCWVCPFSFIANATFVSKEYRNDNTWATPFNTMAIIEGSAADGTWEVQLTVGAGSRTVLDFTNEFKLPLGVWSHLGFTYDGSNINVFMNGTLINTTATTGAIDYGTHGTWDIGCIRSTGAIAYSMMGGVRRVILSTVARPASWFAAVYKAGVGARY